MLKLLLAGMGSGERDLLEKRKSRFRRSIVMDRLAYESEFLTLSLENAPTVRPFVCRNDTFLHDEEVEIGAGISQQALEFGPFYYTELELTYFPNRLLIAPMTNR